MTQSLMLVAIGFLTATLIGLFVIQLVWRRAVAVTANKLTTGLDPEAAKAAIEKSASQDILLQDLRDEKSALELRHEETRQQAETLGRQAEEIGRQAEELGRHATALEHRVAELENAYIAESERRLWLEDELRQIEAKVKNFVEGLRGNLDGFSLAAQSSSEQVSPEPAPLEETVPEETILAETDIAHTDISQADNAETQAFVEDIAAQADPVAQDHLYARELAAIKASLDSEALAVEPGAAPSGKEEKFISPEQRLDERIRILEAGVH